MPRAAEVLEQVPFFAGLNQRQLRKLAQKCRERQFEPGTQVVRQGTMGGVGFFVVADGKATVSVNGRKRARLGPGDSFGELALITERERAATVTAETPLTCLELASWDLREFVMSDPEVAWRLLQHVIRMLVDDRG